jgi:hypothetical protein
MVAILRIPDPDRARPCPADCGVPVVEADTATGSQTIHTGTWRSQCTPKRENE